MSVEDLYLTEIVAVHVANACGRPPLVYIIYDSKRHLVEVMVKAHYGLYFHAILRYRPQLPVASLLHAIDQELTNT